MVVSALLLKAEFLVERSGCLGDILGHVDVYHTLVHLVVYFSLVKGASGLQGVPLQYMQHTADTCLPVILVSDETSCLPLHILDDVNVP